MTVAAETGTLVQLEPEDIITDENSRYSLKKYRIERLAAEILQSGGVNTPIEVEPIEADSNADGLVYRLTAGFYRHAAVVLLNSNGANLTLPAMVVKPENEVVRLRRQLSENMERENQSPMDKAIAIRKLQDMKCPPAEIRKIFAMPGGRKGLSLQPASNSHINMMLSFLEFPKAIQNKIHEGTITVGAAYKLTQHPKEDWDKILEAVEADRQKDIDKSEKEEEKFLNSQKKLTAAEEASTTVETELKTVKETAVAAGTVASEKMKVAADAYLASKKAGLSKEDKDKATKAFKAAEAEAQQADKAAETAKKELVKIEEKAKKVADTVASQKAKLEEARSKAIGARDIDKGAAQVGSEKTKGDKGDGLVWLNATEMRKVIQDLALPGGYEKVQAIGVELVKCISSKSTPKQLFTALAKITGEYKAKGSKA